jgi:hypothetical protein
MSVNMRNGNKRNGNKWTVNEVLTLQREYELLEWTIQEISAKHQRSIGSILFKLTAEGFIPSWNDARGFNIADYAVSVLCQGALCDNDYDNDDDEDYVDEDEDEDEDEEDDDEDYVEEEEEEDDDEDAEYEEDEEEEDAEYEDYVDEEEEDEEVDCALDADQGWNLKDSVTEIGNMVKLMFQVMSASKQKSKSYAVSSAV